MYILKTERGHLLDVEEVSCLGKHEAELQELALGQVLLPPVISYLFNIRQTYLFNKRQTYSK
jgi:hypothetical protein